MEKTVLDLMQEQMKFLSDQGKKIGEGYQNVPDHDCHASPDDGCEVCVLYYRDVPLRCRGKDCDSDHCRC